MQTISLMRGRTQFPTKHLLMSMPRVEGEVQSEPSAVGLGRLRVCDSQTHFMEVTNPQGYLKTVRGSPQNWHKCVKDCCYKQDMT